MSASFCCQAILQDFNNLKNKIDQINNLSENVSRSIDPQGLQAINTTLSVFNDRVRTLEVGIKDRELHLQVRPGKGKSFLNFNHL